MSEALIPDDSPTGPNGPDGRPRFFGDPAMDRFEPPREPAGD